MLESRQLCTVTADFESIRMSKSVALRAISRTGRKSHDGTQSTAGIVPFPLPLSVAFERSTSFAARF